MKMNLVGPSYSTDIVSFGQQKSINWFMEGDLNDSIPAKYPTILLPTPGITLLKDYGDFTIGRGSIVFRDIAYVVLGNTFASLGTDGTPSYIDILDTDDVDVQIVSGGEGPFMVDGDGAYLYSLTTNTFTKVADADLPANPISCAYYQGFYILAFSSSDKIYYSFDPLSWDALDFNSANSNADYITALKVVHDELWIFGTASTQVFYNSGDALVPLQSRPGVLLDKGCRAPATIVAIEDAIHWLGTDIHGGYSIFQSQGYNAVPVATPALVAEIATYTTVEDAYAFGHRVGLHEFYVITFPTENKTWVYDVLTKQWHERMSIVDQDPFISDPLYRAHRAKAHCYADGTHYVLDQYTGAVSKYDTTVYTEYDNPLYRIRRTSQLSADNPAVGQRLMYDNKLHSYYNFTLNMEPGVGLDDNSDPQVQLSISTDAGFTWQDCGSRSLGMIGVFDVPIKWDILGQARNMVFEITVTDPVKAVLLGGTVDVISDSV